MGRLCDSLPSLTLQLRVSLPKAWIGATQEKLNTELYSCCDLLRPDLTGYVAQLALIEDRFETQVLGSTQSSSNQMQDRKKRLSERLSTLE